MNNSKNKIISILILVSVIFLFSNSFVLASSEKDSCKEDNEHKNNKCEKQKNKKGITILIPVTERRDYTVNGTKGNDAITNNGELVVKRTSSFSSGKSKSVVKKLTISGDDEYEHHAEDEYDKEYETDEAHYASIPDYNPILISTIPIDTIGISTDKGNDTVVNNGKLDVTSNTTVANEIGTALAVTTGITTAQGDDTIINNGTVTVLSSANLFINNLIFNFIEPGISVDVSKQSVAIAIGFSGAAGEDTLINNGLLNVTADAKTKISKYKVSFVDTPSGDISTAANAAVVAIDSGAGDDKINNTGTINATAITESTVDDVKLAAITLSNGNTAVSSNAIAFGINAAAGHDEINNSGTITVKSSAYARSAKADVSLVNLSIVSDIINPANDSSVSSESFSTGIYSGAGHDIIRNTGEISVAAKSETLYIDFLWSANFLTNPASIISFPDLFQQPILESSTTATANSVGINSGAGHDDIYNSGMLKSIANADVTAYRVRVGFPDSDLKVPKMSFIPSVFAANLSTASSATAIGIYSGEGHDIVNNSGLVSALVESNALSSSVSVSVKSRKNPDPNRKFSLSLGAALVDVTAQSSANTSAIVTAAGHDTVINSGAVNSDATADANAVNADVSLEGSDSTITVNAALAKAQTEASANATGISTGSGHDKIVNTGTVFTTSTADTDSNTVIFDGKILIDTKLTLGAKLIKTNTQATTNSIGVSAGSGDDLIVNKNEITTMADSFADSNSVSATIRAQPGVDKVSIIGEGSWIQSDTIANATVNGVSGGSGKDKIFNSGLIDSEAYADPNSVGVKAIGVGTPKGASVGIGLIQSNTKGTATSSGISGGADKDIITNSGTVKSTATTDVDATKISASLTLTETGVALSGSALLGTTEANSTARGISGDGGADVINSTGVIDVFADADVQSTSVDVSVGAVDKGLSLTGSAIDASTSSSADSAAILGGKGKDRIWNQSTLDSKAESEGRSTGVSVTLHGSITGVTGGVALARANTDVSATSNGIRGGRDNDIIINSGEFNSTAKSEAWSTLVAVDIGAANTGLTISGAAADSSTISNSYSNGLMGDEGDDLIKNTGVLTSSSTAITHSNNVSVSLNGAVTGVSVGVALARATTESHSQSTGLNGGSGNDNIINKQHITTTADSNADSVGVSVAAGATGQGLNIEGSAVDASAITTATTIGIDGGRGKNNIFNSAEIDATATGISNSTGVGVSVSGTGTGVPLGVALSRATTDATANSTGIRLGLRNKLHHDEEDDDEEESDDDDHESEHHDSNRHKNKTSYNTEKRDHESENDEGDDDDSDEHHPPQTLVVNSGTINSTATANSEATAVSVTAELAGVGLAAGVAAAQTGVTATANANGIIGSYANDTIINKGIINATSDADAEGNSVAVALNVAIEGVALGATFTDASTHATANSIGIDGGDGRDQIANQADINSIATADAKAASISVNGSLAFVPGGAAFADLTSTATSNAIAIDGGAGNDFISSVDTLDSNATSISTGTSVAVNIGLGVAFGDAAVVSEAYTTGINGGSGNDEILHKGSTISKATATSTGTSVAVTLVGADFADTSNKANSNAIAIDGNKGNDWIKNIGTLESTSKSTATGTSVGVVFTGASFSDVSNVATASSSGITGGSENDLIRNSGEIKSTATATTTNVNVSVTAFGAAIGDISSEADSKAVGIDSGSDNDMILNSGDLILKSYAKTKASTDTWNYVGAALTKSSVTATADVVGLNAGNGDDWLENDAKIDLLADGSSKSRHRTINILAGAAIADAGLTSNSSAAGFNGAEGNDTLINRGEIIGSSKAKVTAAGFSYSTIGATSGDTETSSNASATGIDGGADDDIILNKGRIKLTSTATATTNSKSITIIGASKSSDALTGKARVYGLKGGTGNDWLRNEKIIDVNATSNMKLANSSLTIVGSSKSGGSIYGDSIALGMSGGTGNNLIENLLTLTAKSKVTLTLNSSKFNLAGVAATDDTLRAKATSIGIAAGAGNDTARNKGAITVIATSNLTALEKTTVTFGKSTASAASSSDPLAIGIDVGDGTNFIGNFGSINVTSSATTTSSESSYTFTGSSTSKADLQANSRSIALNSGSGNDTVFNSGSVTVKSASNITATGGASVSVAGNARVASTVTSKSIVSGMNTGSGNDKVINLGTVTVTASSNSSSKSNANAAIYFSNGRSLSKAKITNEVHGINVGSGNNLILNEGKVKITATGKANTRAISDGDTIDNLLGIDQDAYATSSSTATSGADGILAANGNNEIENSGEINVLIASSAYSYSYADGDAVFSGDGDAFAYSYANSAKAYGIKFGEGNNRVTNTGKIIVKSKPDSSTGTLSDADGLDAFRDPDSKATSKSYANDALAVGISLGDGQNTVINNGLIDVVTAPNVNRAYAHAYYGNDIVSIDTFAYAYAYANNATAIGIDLGDGNNKVLNTGTINVASLPLAVSRALSTARGPGGDATAKAYSQAKNALAVGIKTGNGNNSIVNNGVIKVRARPTASASATASPAGFGSKTRVRSQLNNNAKAIGIWTGSGDDLIVNNGSITVDAFGTGSREYAIRSGAGNDTVSLMTGSLLTGDIDFGTGDDTLHVLSTSILNGTVYGGKGDDTVVFDGEGKFSSALVDFQNTMKKGKGLYSLTELASMKKINVLDGILRVDNDYQFNLDGTFIPAVATGQSGTFEVTGTVTLAGDINVIRGRGHYIDGDKYDILKASGGFLEDSTFDDVIVPKKAPLLKFEYIKNKDTLQIKTDVEAFDTVATTKNEHAIAGYLDRVLENAEGDVSVVLGEIQALSANEHSAAFSKLSPENYTQLSQVAVSSVHRYNTNLHQRMRVLREDKLFNKEFQYNPYTVRFNDDNGYMRTQPDEFRTLFNQVQDTTNTDYGFWLKGLRQSGAIENSSQLSTLGFNQRGQSFGFDSNLSSNWIFGGSYGFVGSVMDFESDNAGDIETSLYSLYSSYFSKHSYLDWTFTQGNHDYLNQRNYSVGLLDVNTNSAYTANVISTSIASGYYLPLQNKRLEVYSSLQYLRQDENGISETGGAGIAVAPYEIQSLQSQLGVRLGQHFSQHSYRFYTEVALGWLHEFDLGHNQITTSFAGLSGTGYTIEQQQLAQDGILLSTGLVVSNQKQLQTVLDYNTEIRKNYTSQSIMGSVRYNF